MLFQNWPVPHEVRTLLVYGGAFDPPHKAHVDLPERARTAMGIDWILYVPAASAPLKKGPVAGAEDRLAMLEAAIADLPRARLTPYEISTGGTSYTIDTLRAFGLAFHYVETMRLLIGADQAAQFHKWRDYEEVIELAEPVVLLRGGDFASVERELLEKMRPHWSDEALEQWRRRVVETPVIDADSTTIRRILRESEKYVDDPRVVRAVPDAVREVIRARGLYRSPDSAAQ